MSSTEKNKTCFIITPIGADGSSTRRAAEGVIDAVIIPVLKELGFKIEDIAVAHRMPNPGSITKQVINRILEDDLVVVNLSGLNPNVMYELAIRHAVRKPVIQIIEKDTQLPFDVIEERTIPFINDMAGVVDLKEKFKEMVPKALDDKNPDNPIYRVIEGKSVLKEPTLKTVDKYLFERIDMLESKVLEVLNKIKNTYF